MTLKETIVKTIVISFVFFLILFLLNLIDETDFKLNPVHIFIALVPFIILLVVSGKLKEIRGPGGLTLIMQEEARKTVTPESEEKLVLHPAEVMQKKAPINLAAQIAKKPPTTLSFILGSGYSIQAIDDYIKELSKHPVFQNILFTDEKGKFKGFMKAEDFEDFFREGDVDLKIQSGQVLDYPRTIKNFVKIDSTNQQALSEMENARKNMLAVVDQNEMFAGIITQEEIVRKILTKVLREA